MIAMRPPAHTEAALDPAVQLRAMERPYTLRGHALLAQQAARESNARSYPRRLPLALRRAQGVYVEDVEGRVFIDCLAAAGALPLGHNHPVVREAIEQALRDGVPLQTLDLTTPLKQRFVEELFELLPDDLARRGRIQFCGPSGSDAVEAALKLVKTATGRSTIAAFHGAYHGMTQGSLALMGNLAPKRSARVPMVDIQLLPYPHDYRCPFGLGGERGMRAALAYAHSVLHDPESGVMQPAGLVLEPIQGEGGVIVAPDAFLRGLSQLAAARGIPLVLDEVQTGIARTGERFAFEHAGIVPDVVVLSKAIGGGLPLAVIVYDAALDGWSAGTHAGTFRGNQLAMATGAATLRFVRTEQLALRARSLGQRLRSGLLQLQARHAFIGDVRGRGLMQGLEIVDPDGPKDAQGHPPPDPRRSAALQRACLLRGLIVELGGRLSATLRLLPPLIIEDEELDRVLSVLELAACAAAHSSDL